MACFIRPHAIPSRQTADFTPFNPLLNFLEDFATQFQPDNATSTLPHTRAGASSSKRSETKPTPTYTPRFDIIETDHAYELYGELPGVKSEDLNVEFADEKTLTVSGLVARTASSPSTAAVPATTEKQVSQATRDEQEQEQEQEQKRKMKQAAVEDTDDFEDLSSSASTPTSDHAPTTAPDPAAQFPEDFDASNSTAASATVAAAPQPEPNFVLNERKYGSFERTFKFQVPVEKEDVSARLRDGVLFVRVPKRVEVKRRVWVSVE